METREMNDQPILMDYDKTAMTACLTAAKQGVQIRPSEGKMRKDDPVNHPSHYTSHPSGVECIEISKWYDFCIGNVFKYIWRSGLKQEKGMSKDSKALEDLKKARWYLDQEIAMREQELKEH